MAEIRIEKKKPVWPWVLLAIIVVGVILFFLLRDYDTDETDMNNNANTEETDQMDQEDMNTAAWKKDTLQSEYDRTGKRVSDSAYIGNNSQLGRDSTYTSSAFTKLINAVEMKAMQKNIELSADIQEMKNQAQQLSMNLQEPAMKDLSNKIAGVFQKIQEKAYPTLQKEVQDLKEQAQQIGAAETFDENGHLKDFFKRASQLLQKMN